MLEIAPRSRIEKELTNCSNCSRLGSKTSPKYIHVTYIILYADRVKFFSERTFWNVICPNVICQFFLRPRFRSDFHHCGYKGCVRLCSHCCRCRSFTPSAKTTAAQFVVRLHRDISYLRSYLESPAQDALLAVLHKRTFGYST